MDWGKTKNIFIISFLLLNLILGYQLYIKYNSYNQIWTLDSKEELDRILDKSGIVLNVEIPQTTQEISLLRVTNNIESVSDSIKWTSGLNINSEKVEVFLDERISNYNEYEYSTSESNNKNLFVYNQINNGYLFFDAKIIVEIDQDSKITYRKNYFEVINLGFSKQVITSTEAIKIAVEEKVIFPYSNIDNIKLGYRGQGKNNAIFDLIPVWAIECKLNNGNYIIYVNALTGGIEQDY
ncbi:MAG: two-component system regulatory protein YycI [Vulcanibacillus sp.]